MAIKVNSTTVINDSRALQNITSLDSATVSAMNLAGVGAASYNNITSNYTASSGELISANTTGGSFTITLPSSPSVGQSITIADIDRSWVGNNLTVAASGKTFTDNKGTVSANSKVFDQPFSVEFIYTTAGLWFYYTVSTGFFPTHLFMPNWSSADDSVTSGSGTWTAPSTWNSEDTVIALLVGAGNAGAGYQYPGQNWQPGGDGGHAKVLVGTTELMSGGSYSIGAGQSSNSGQWQRPGPGNPTTFQGPLGGLVYTTAPANTNDFNVGAVLPNYDISETSSAQVSDSNIIMNKLQVTANSSAIETVSTWFGNRLHGGTSSNNHINGPAVFSGGNGRSFGFGVTTAAGAVSAYSGNGGQNFGDDGTAPGGAGAGPVGNVTLPGGDGAAGSIRFYRQPQ
jgi:hypothetical protein